MSLSDRPLVWLDRAPKSPPLSLEARVEAGVLLRRLQRGETIGMPHARPMPGIGRGCHELRVRDRDATWRLIYRIDQDAIVILGVFGKKTQTTLRKIIETCRERARRYDAA